MEEVPPRNKRLRAGEKQKKKVDSRPSCVWDDAGVSVARAQETFSADKVKVFFGVPADDVARRHLHKLMQVTLWFHSLCASICFAFFFFFFFKACILFVFIQVLGENLHITLEYLASEAKVKSARSHASSVEAENS